MLEYVEEKKNEMIADSLRAVTGWEGPIIAGEDGFIFFDPEQGTPTRKTTRNIALDVHEKVNKRGGTRSVIKQLEHRSILNILTKRI